MAFRHCRHEALSLRMARRIGPWIKHVTGLVFMGFGLKLATDTMDG